MNLTWMNHAACRGADPALFFPENGGTGSTRDALAICATCPVIAQCRAYIDAVESAPRATPHGVWGGLTADDRRRNRRTSRTRTREVAV